MARLSKLIAVLVSIGLVGQGKALAADSKPKKIKVGILLPLTGTFAAVAETQKQGALLAIDEVNRRGGLNMPWGKVQVEGVVADDEAKQDVGVRRYRYMVSEGVKGVGGQTWAPLAYAINALVKKEPMPYFPTCIMGKDAFKKGALAPTTFGVAYSPWTVGYMAGTSAVKTLGKKRIFFLARSDSWGWDIRDGVYAAAKQYGAEIVGYDEVALGTSDFTTILQKVRAANPDVFIFAQFAADAVAVLKQVNQMGLGKDITIFNAFMTNVVARGAADALGGVYAMHFFYYDLAGFPDPQAVKSAQDFTKIYEAKYNVPPDSYGTLSYIAYQQMLKGFELAKSFDPEKVAAALAAQKSFETPKGEATWRRDHSAIYKYAAFLVKGKPLSEQKNPWDLFTVEGALGGDSVLPTLQSLGY